jgi:lipopolysaccharide transport system permease protein
MLAALMFYYGIQPTWSLLLLPVLLCILGFAAMGIGTILAALNVAYRDFKYTIPFLVQIWMFATPSIYMEVNEAHLWQGGDEQEVAARESGDKKVYRSKTDIIVDSVKPLLAANPMTSVIAFFRAAVLGGPLPWTRLGHATAIIGLVFLVGVFYFRRIESRFADII